MTQSAGAELRRRRAALGWTVDHVATRLAIPADLVSALEDGDARRLPPGPYTEAHLRAYRRELDRAEQDPSAEDPAASGAWAVDQGPPSLPTPDGDEGPASQPVIRVAEAEPEAVAPSLPLRTVRTIALVSTSVAALLALVLGGTLVERIRARPAVDDGWVDVVVELRRTARLRVEVDGRLAAHREFAGGDRLAWRGREKVSVDVPSVDLVRVAVDGQDVSPRGRQDSPRRLTFSRVAP